MLNEMESLQEVTVLIKEAHADGPEEAPQVAVGKCDAAHKSPGVLTTVRSPSGHQGRSFLQHKVLCLQEKLLSRDSYFAERIDNLCCRIRSDLRISGAVNSVQRHLAWHLQSMCLLLRCRSISAGRDARWQCSF